MKPQFRHVLCTILLISTVVFLYTFIVLDCTAPRNIYSNNTERLQQGHALKKPVEFQCSPRDRVVFIKTHKTASTTVASIFERFGYSRNLTFGVKIGTHVISSNDHFQRHMIHQSNSRHEYHFLTNHVRYNRKEMEAVFPNATYVTILRNPVSQFTSAFGYFGFAKSTGLSEVDDPVGTFFSNTKKYYDMPKKFFFKNQAKNGQIYDLGLDTKFQEDKYYFDIVFEALKRELDIVLISEYFNHSLVLMKKALCWNWDDILYIPKTIRSSTIRYSITSETKIRILAWNNLDKELYDHYNKTLWKNIEEYGPMFWKDLDEFTSRLTTMYDECVDTSRRDRSDYREDNIVIKYGARKFCRDIYLNDVKYSALIRKRQGIR